MLRSSKNASSLKSLIVLLNLRQTVYAVEPIDVRDPLGNLVDPAEIYFGRSTDFAQSWETTFTVGPHPDVSDLVCEEGSGVDCLDQDRGVPLNDDNDARTATSLSATEVNSGQAFSQIATDAQGNIAVIWYDQRRDPSDVKLDVFYFSATR